MTKIVLIVLFCLATWNMASAEAKYKLVVPLSTGEDNYNYQAVTAFKQYVESRANGQIEVEIYTSGSLCASGRECFEGMKSGLVDIYQSTFGESSNLWPALAALDLPYMLRDDEVAECVFDDADFMDMMRKGLLNKTKNIRLMVVSNSGGWRNFATTKKPIYTPNDIKGMKIRTIPAEIQQELVRQLKGAPTGISWPEVYTSLATGVVEGTKNGITDIVTMNFQEHLKYITLDGHAYMGGTWYMNNDKFKSMPPDLRMLVLSGFNIIEQYLRAYPKYHDVKSYETFVKAGGKIIALDNKTKADFRKATSGMQDWYLKQGKENKKMLADFKAVTAKCEKKVDADLKAGIN